MPPKMNKTVTAKGLDIRTILTRNEKDYMSLTDIAKFRDAENPRFIIQNWLRNRNTIEYLGIWEGLNNPDFNRVEFDTFRNAAGTNGFVLTPQRWIESTNAIGIQSKAGRYGGTYAHTDIAFKFAAWLSPEFELYIIKDYQRLKQDESERLSLDWDARREIAKTNYRIHTDAIKENLITPELPAHYKKITYASEADIINVALFGMTAKEWQAANPNASGNIRDNADIFQLIVLSNLETINATLINANMPQAQRLEELRKIAASQLKSVTASPAAKRLKTKIEQ